MSSSHSERPSGGIITGTSVPAVSGSEFTGWDIRQGTPREAVYGDASAENIRAAVDAAATAFRASQFADDRRSVSPLLRAIATSLEANAAQLILTAAAETGLDAEARLVGELARTTGQLRMLADESDHRSGSSLAEDAASAAPPQPSLVLGQVPLGPVAVFGASNFPFAFGVLGGDTAAALAAGCPVIAKGHPAHPETSDLLGRIAAGAVAGAGFDPGWFSLVQGRANEVGTTLATAHELQAVAFTGSTAGGLALTELAARRPRPIPVYAELGGINALYLLPGAAAGEDHAAAGGFVGGLAASLTGGSGQFCTKPGLLVLVDDDAGERIVAGLASALAPVRTPPLLTAATTRAYSAALDELGSTPGVALLARPDADLAPGVAVGAAIATISSDDLRRSPHAADEIFGPAVLVVRCSDRADLLATVDAIPSGLTATIHSGPGDDDLVVPLLRRLRLRAGRVLFGGFPTGVRVGTATTHGGPFPATTAPWSTSVGARAIDRFVRPVTYQNLPDVHRTSALSWT